MGNMALPRDVSYCRFDAIAYGSSMCCWLRRAGLGKGRGRILAAFLNILALSLLVAEEPLLAPRGFPNILLVTADNLGFGDLPCYNPNSEILAPNFDRLSREGARLTQFYSASPTCTVSRASLLTGRIPQRHGLVRQLPGLEGNYGVGLNPAEILIPQILKQASKPYLTGCFGKWNIGFAPGSRPTERGFDEFVGHASGNMDYFRHNYRDRHDLYAGTAELHREGTYSTSLFATAAIDFIQRHSKGDRPWFCYLPFNAPHFPSPLNRRPGENNEWQAPDWAFEACGLSANEARPEKRYQAVVYALDFALGQVLDCLHEAQVEDQTLVFFMSDNGSFRLGREGIDVGSNAPLRSGGVTCWEGGLRVPALVRFPGLVKPGTVISAPMWSPDLMPSFAALAACPLPENVIYDGMNVIPFLRGRSSATARSFYFEYRNHSALRRGDWKIVRETPSEPWQLFDLGEDLREKRDLATRFPGKLKELVAERARWLHSLR